MTLTALDRILLEHMEAQGWLIVGPENALSLAQSFGTSPQELLDAMARLVREGLAREEHPPFTGGGSGLRITGRGMALIGMAGTTAAEPTKRRIERPLWVAVGLWGGPGRLSAWGFFWLSLALAVGSFVYGLFDSRFLVGGVFFLSALWYWLAIRWVDRHDSWS
jgi:hypothetical protein